MLSLMAKVKHDNCKALMMVFSFLAKEKDGKAWQRSFDCKMSRVGSDGLK